MLSRIRQLVCACRAVLGGPQGCTESVEDLGLSSAPSPSTSPPSPSSTPSFLLRGPCPDPFWPHHPVPSLVPRPPSLLEPRWCMDTGTHR